MRKAIIALFLIGICGCFIETTAQNKLLRKFQKTNVRKTANWKGEWTRASRFYGGSLHVKTISAAQISFKLNAFSGANLGEIEGRAKVRGNAAYFDDRQTKKSSSVFNCQVLLINNGRKIEVETSKECQNYAGLNVNFEGDYEKGKGTIPESDFVYLEVFPDKRLDAKFKTLVGAKEYENFLDAFHVITEKDDLDGLNAKVFAACVRGICPSMTGIIMFDKQGNLWAAVADDQYPESYFVNYYTNVESWRGKLPRTIENWIKDKDFTEEKIIINYKSKK